MSFSIQATSTTDLWQSLSSTSRAERRPPSGPPPAPPEGDTVELSAELLAMLDKDKDGSIDLATEAQGAAGMGGPPPPPFVTEADSDGDGAVSAEELSTAFAKIDSDGDGTITGAEWKADMAKHAPPMPPGGMAGGSTSSVSIDRDLLQQLLEALKEARAAR